MLMKQIVELQTLTRCRDIGLLHAASSLFPHKGKVALFQGIMQEDGYPTTATSSNHLSLDYASNLIASLFSNISKAWGVAKLYHAFALGLLNVVLLLLVY